MDHYGMVGTTYRRGGQEGIARFTFAPDQTEERMVSMHQACGFAESIYLSTCNRVEVIFAGHGGVPVAEYRRRIYRYFASHRNLEGEEATDCARALHAYSGEGAAEHLFCVAASLDSMNPGEAQILGQVKEAHRRAAELGLVGRELGLLMEEAYEAAKHVRASTTLGTRALSMLSLAQGLIDERLARSRASRAVVVGAGDMAVQCGESLAERPGVDLVFANRTLAKAEALARRCGGGAVSLAAWLQRPGAVDVLVTATASEQPLFGSEFFAALDGRRPLVIDLAVPRDTDPAAAQAHGVELYDVDRLGTLAEENRRSREKDIAQARLVIDESLCSLRRRQVARNVGPVLQQLRQHLEQTAQTSLEGLSRGALRNLNDDQKAALTCWARRFVGRVAHIPTVGLKRIAFDYGMEAVRAFVEGTGVGSGGEPCACRAQRMAKARDRTGESR